MQAFSFMSKILNFKYYLFTLFIIATVFSVQAMKPVFAQTPVPGTGNSNTQVPGTGNTNTQPPQQPAPQGTFTLTNPLKVNSIGDLVKNFVDIFSTVVIILAVLTLIWVGLQFILARGDVAKMKELKEWLLWIVVGIAVVISARLIVDIVINTLSATGTIDANTLNTIKSAK
jgi:hypothetical protein